mmetsp:Transcript_17739/g.26261  ORF Transcript_17739/g.26261 Transcript_17739/m.26261 type:complete len:86 (+) Transcript_17739:184-441(+)
MGSGNDLIVGYWLLLSLQFPWTHTKYGEDVPGPYGEHRFSLIRATVVLHRFQTELAQAKMGFLSTVSNFVIAIDTNIICFEHDRC